MKIVSIEAITLATPARERRAADQTHEAALVRDHGGRRDRSGSARRRSRRPSSRRSSTSRRRSPGAAASRTFSSARIRETRRRCGPNCATQPSGRPASGSGASPSPGSTWRSGTWRGRHWEPRVAPPRRRAAEPDRPVPDDVQRPEPAADHDPEHQRARRPGRHRRFQRGQDRGAHRHDRGQRRDRRARARGAGACRPRLHARRSTSATAGRTSTMPSTASAGWRSSISSSSRRR